MNPSIFALWTHLCLLLFEDSTVRNYFERLIIVFIDLIKGFKKGLV